MTLKERREQLGLTQREIAFNAHVHITAYQRFEDGKRSLQRAQQRTVQNLANAFRCSVAELLGGEDV